MNFHSIFSLETQFHHITFMLTGASKTYYITTFSYSFIGHKNRLNPVTQTNKFSTFAMAHSVQRMGWSSPYRPTTIYVRPHFTISLNYRRLSLPFILSLQYSPQGQQ